jgi:1-acyl-sn-glycerol-3-phosphate acyltransferase
MNSGENVREEQILAIFKAFFNPSDPDDLDAVCPEILAEVAPLIDRFCRFYFRQEVEGIHLVPKGKTLIVGNHNAGITFIELLGMGARWYLERGTADIIHGLGHDLIVAVPLLKNFLIQAGGVRASHENAGKLFKRGRKLLVCPGGNLEAFRPFKDRHKINLGNRKGFVRLALRHQVPISPVVFIGGHETFFVLNDGQAIVKRLPFLKKVLRMDTFPLVAGLPWGISLGPLFHLPLPAKSGTRFLPPISLDQYAPEDEHDPAVVQEVYDTVTAAMQRALTDLAAQRRFPVLG